MHPQAEALAQAFISDFWAANHDITWLAVEQEKQLWLSPNTVLVGRVDAEGLTGDGDPFFGEWKSASAGKARRMAEEKAKWRRDPQALTYGVLLGETRRFLVRWAIKTPRPTTDFEWYSYSEAEVDHWRSQLIDIASEIRESRIRRREPWRTNFGNCYRYGVAYACPFIDSCPDGPSFNGSPRVPHLKIEREMKAGALPSDLIILDASRVGDYLGCPEEYRRKWEDSGYSETSEALTIGSDFHSLVAAHLRTLIKTKEVTNASS